MACDVHHAWVSFLALGPRKIRNEGTLTVLISYIRHERIQGDIMMLCVALGIMFVVAAIWLWLRRKRLSGIPGPGGSCIWGNAWQLADRDTIHRTLAAWSRQYGPVYTVRLLHQRLVVVSGQHALQETLVTKGFQTGGRPTGTRLSYFFKNTGILLNTEPDATWRLLRKISQRHMKQFGDGMSRLEVIITSVADDMFRVFRKNAGKPFDPKAVINLTSLKSISFLLSGQRASDDDPLVQMVENMLRGFIYVAPITTPGLMLYDWFPWLRHLRLKTWRSVERLAAARDSTWQRILDTSRHLPDDVSIANRLLLQAEATKLKGVGNGNRNHGNGHSESEISDTDAKLTCVTLFLAGIATTAYSFHSLVNLLAHHTDVQEQIRKEIVRIVPGGRSVALENKPEMPYTSAVVLEALRYTSVSALGIPHRVTRDVKISGFLIPKDTPIITNLWALHHDPDVWGDPHNFRPDRFLTSRGELVPADHILRKHLMPFGAGTRVCVGESLALARLFIWTASLVQRFDISPAAGNLPQLTHTDNYRFGAVVASRPYEVIVIERTAHQEEKTNC